MERTNKKSKETSRHTSYLIKTIYDYEMHPTTQPRLAKILRTFLGLNDVPRKCDCVPDGETASGNEETSSSSESESESEDYNSSEDNDSP